VNEEKIQKKRIASAMIATFKIMVTIYEYMFGDFPYIELGRKESDDN